MKIHLSSQPFNPWQEIQSYQAGLSQFGATDIFIGTMRDYNEGNQVHSMVLEYYPGMTEKQLEKIITEAQRRWQIIDALVVHRVGEIMLNDTIVLVSVWAAHRGDAFDACRYIMEALKSSAPFWKKEQLASGVNRWVGKNTDGYKTP